MASDYGLRISKMLLDAEPGLLVCDPGATGTAMGLLANVLGSLMATVLTTKGEATYRAVLKEIVGKIDEAARATQLHVLREIASGSAEAKN